MGVPSVFSSLRNGTEAIDDAEFDFSLGLIISDEQHGRKCEVFDEYLVYLFYGRPAFRWEEKGERKGIYPICFQFASNAIEPHRIFPFDSGAFYHNYYNESTLNFSGKLEDYLLYGKDKGLPSTQIPQLVHVVWQTNRSYYEGRLLAPLSNVLSKSGLSSFDKEYLTFVNKKAWDQSERDGDSRAYTIEFQIKNHLSLEALERVILPDCIEEVLIGKLTDFLNRACDHEVEIITSNCVRSVNSMFDSISVICQDTVQNIKWETLLE